MTSSSRSSSSVDDELRLPRPPGVIRQFWARHPVLVDVIVTLATLAVSMGPAAFVSRGQPAGVWVTVLTTAACLLLLRRRQWPIIVFCAAALAEATYMLVGASMGGPLMLVAAYTLAVYRSSRACWIGLGSAIGGLVVLAAPLTMAGAVSVITALNVIAGAVVMGLIGALIGVNIGNRKRYLEAVIARSRQLLVERDQHAQLAAVAERARIAREMHDVVSHSLTVVVALAEGAAATDDRDQARAALAHVSATARGALQEMRTMLGVLRDDHAAPDAPLSPVDDETIATAVSSAQHAGFPVRLTVTGDPAGVARTVRLALARLVQEGLTNAIRHAPLATTIDVAVAVDASHATVDIRNDGVAPSGAGPAHSAPGSAPRYGLVGLRERIEHVGGTFTATADGPGRWRLRACIPLAPEPIPLMPDSGDAPVLPLEPAPEHPS